jgi:uncharacterized repeat protein (TIGR02543 family)
LRGGSWLSSRPTSYAITSAAITLPIFTGVTRNGYVFLRWRDSTTNAIVTTIPTGSTGNKSYYAEWGYTTDDYDNAVDDAYNNGYDDGKAAYPEYGYVYWRILTDSDAAGGLTEYILHSSRLYNYGDTYILPTPPSKVYSKQYEYEFKGWSLGRQTSDTMPAKVVFPQTHGARDIYYYAVYERTEREYTVTWVIPVITDGQLDYKSGNATVITETYKYGESITSLTLAELYGTGANYLPNGWSATQGGAKITDFGKCMGERTFYARYIPQPTV